ncbi:hypothetical protein O6H91_12G014800 [Diphasiastrum complanatum]|uniref:Uncharacterized protein n=1 Tax=Diphasiastrum complanatum TaxID=34168 RepID=A0ACC2BZ34_DIPCM|nr:hypothetical protein O6H91_12G014800 [Diphasiastrum complanatum]
MGRVKHGGRRKGLMGSSTSYMLDPLLLPRLQQYAYNNNISDLDDTVEYLRNNYKEYQRKQLGPFRRLVSHAINVVKQRPAFEPPAVVVEEDSGRPHHLASSSRQDPVRRHGARSSPGYRVSAPNSEASGEEDGAEDGENSFSDGELVDGKRKRAAKGVLSSSRSRGLSESESESYFSEMKKDMVLRPSFNLLNSSLRATYNGRPALVIEGTSSSRSLFGAEDPSFVAKSNLKEAAKDNIKQQLDSKSVEIESDAKAAFAPPTVVAQAARAALGAGKKSHKSRTLVENTREQGVSVLGSVDKIPNRSFPPAQFSGRSPFIEKPTSYLHASPVSGEVPLLRPAIEASSLPEQTCKDDGVASNLGRGLIIDTQETTGTLENHKRRRSVTTGVNGERDHSESSKRGRWAARKEKDSVASETGQKFSASAAVLPEKIRFKDLGGIQKTVGEILEIIYPLYHPQIYPWLGLQPMRGLLLHGPPGCGKTKLANAIAFETNLPFLKISAPEVVSGMSGESEAKVRALFQEALKLAPSIIFIDEIDVISIKRESAQREMERRLVTQLMTCMDELNQPLPPEDQDRSIRGKTIGHVLVIGATNRPEALDPALRRPGRFDREIGLGIPDEIARIQILTVLAKNLRLEGSFDFGEIAKCTPGFVGADLAALTKEAASVAIKRILASRVQCSSSTEDDDPWWERPWTQEELKTLSITMSDFKEAVTKVQPSTKREGFSSIPDVTWEDVGSLNSIRDELDFFVARRIKHPEDYEALQLNMDSGFLLYGPPGCGKTLVAKAVANAAGANFIYIKGPELLNKYVGESERAVRQLFSRARTCAPCVLFFDEIDAMAPRRGSDGNAAAERVVNQLLIEMDGLEQRKGIFLLAATNRPDMIDPAMLRPGRLGKPLYVPLPDAQGRISILRTLTRRKPLDSDTDLVSIGQNECCEGLSGADLAALVNEACVAAIRERSWNIEAVAGSTQGALSNPLVICHRHFEEAFTKVHPSVSIKEISHYEDMPRKFSCIEVPKIRRLLKAEAHAPLE